MGCESRNTSGKGRTPPRFLSSQPHTRKNTDNAYSEPKGWNEFYLFNCLCCLSKMGELSRTQFTGEWDGKKGSVMVKVLNVCAVYSWFMVFNVSCVALTISWRHALVQLLSYPYSEPRFLSPACLDESLSLLALKDPKTQMCTIFRLLICP